MCPVYVKSEVDLYQAIRKQTKHFIALPFQQITFSSCFSMKIFQGVNEIGSVSILSITTLQLRHREKENALNLALKTLWNTSFSWSQETFKQHFDIVLAAFWWLPLKLKNQIARSVGKQRCQLAVPQFNAQLNNFFLTWRILTEHLIQKP